MSVIRKDADAEIKSCKDQIYFFKKIASEKCRKIPHGAGFMKGIQPGETFRLLHSELECRKASQDFIDQLEKCISLSPKLI